MSVLVGERDERAMTMMRKRGGKGTEGSPGMAEGAGAGEG